MSDRDYVLTHYSIRSVNNKMVTAVPLLARLRPLMIILMGNLLYAVVCKVSFLGFDNYVVTSIDCCE